ncbi:MAG TPA: 4-hydroxyphenyl-beta-ketoacyl-CoA hydrolase, partial [Pusillimonas sp.]|nr:4-hydroxyphenyl-beta-ketoacyl-CoA hydrolase [Pusillimonas sp.]
KPLILRDNAVRLLRLNDDPVHGRYTRLKPPTADGCC